MERKIRCDHCQLGFRNRGAGCQRRHHTVAQPPCLLQLFVGTSENLLVEKTLPRQRTAEVQGFLAGEPFVHDRRVAGGRRRLEQCKSNGGQQSFEFDIGDGRRLHDAEQEAIA